MKEELLEENIELKTIIYLIFEREKEIMRSKRISLGLQKRLREGKAWGKPPLGYTYNQETKKTEIVEDLAWMIPAMDKMYLEDNLGMKAIADKLNDISSTSVGKKQWNENFVRRSLQSKAYHGIMEKRFNNGETLTIQGFFQPLRTEETWQRIQEKLTSKKVK